jgi:hypothetical protein
MTKTICQDALPIVIVYLNNKLPRYAQKNLNYLSKVFPDHKIFLVSNKFENKRYTRKLENVQFRYLNNFSDEIAKLQEISSLPIDFRNGFWITTTARFKAIEILMQSDSLERVLHIEADVLLFKNFPFDLSVFQQKSLSYPFVSEDSAAASIFYIGDLQELEAFNQFILEMMKANPSISDMGILAKYGNLDSSRVIKLYSGLGKSDPTAGKYLFDAATLGMYLTGQDPRNFKGLIKRYLDTDDHDLKPSTTKFKYSSTDEVGIEILNESYLISNLHIHSKQAKFFSALRSEKLIKSAISGIGRKPKVSFSFSIWLSMSAKYLEKRIRQLRF